MNKKFVIISLIAIAIVGSLVAFYGANLFFSDVSNFGAGFMNTTLFDHCCHFSGLRLYFRYLRWCP